MRDWRKYVQEHMPDLAIATREEVWNELSDHLEDVYVRWLTVGSDENAAVQMALNSVSDWKVLEQEIIEEKEAGMTTFGKQFILPSGVALGLASVALACEIRLGPRPVVWGTGMATFVVYKFWPIALVITGGMAAWLSSRAGGSRERRALVAVTPALYMLIAMLLVVLSVLIGNALHWIPYQRLYWMAISAPIGNWVVLPGCALLVGALPFLGKQEGKQVARV